ncbi:hypothetical protein AB4Y87_20040 [Paenarthrobacter sp. RAF54_2]|uniref:hypothetical protein n=1 Tax=Paenarthrobacter sp. RAF54_2 TaxID=3233061 RepID=UPI003F9E6F4E
MEEPQVEDDFASALQDKFPEHVSLEESMVLIKSEIAFDALRLAEEFGLGLAGIDGFRRDEDGIFPLFDFIDPSKLIEQRAPIQEQYEVARRLLGDWQKETAPDLVELVR